MQALEEIIDALIMTTHDCLKNLYHSQNYEIS